MRRQGVLVAIGLILILGVWWWAHLPRKIDYGIEPVSLEGVASYYGPGFEGRKTASGDIFHSNELTAAHKTLPLGTEVRVTNLENNLSVVVTITDRGPY